MKSALVWVIGIAIVFGGGGGGLWYFNQTNLQNAYDTELSELKREFLTNTQGLFFLEADEYRKEIGPHLSKYFKQLNKLSKKYPDSYDIEREKKKGEARVAKGQMTESQKIQRDERIDIALDLYKRMMGGQYRPLYTLADKNFRFDIYDISPARVGGEHKVKFSYVHWGPFQQAHKPNQTAVSYRSILGNIMAEQEKGKPAKLPQIVGDSQPPSLQVSPERWIEEFIPGVEVGYYDLPQFPSNAKTIQLTFDFGIRTIGGSDLPVNVEFQAMAIPDAWKVPEGQDWEAQERFASDEELQAAGVAPTQ